MRWSEALKNKAAKKMHEGFQKYSIEELEEFKNYIQNLIDKKKSRPNNNNK